MSTIFSKIISGEIPCYKLAEDDRFLAFLDIRPVNPGHTLVIPKQEVDYLFDLEDDLLGGILLFARPIARALAEVVPCKKVGLMVAGLEVPHAHVHLIPFSAIPELTFSRASAMEPDRLEQIAAAVRARLSGGE
ncbi:MAG: HIT family protein [Verrucomicrobia bacterium]|nr:HIT family protein [Kiritimatiellia bacterium]MCP5489246.1 HIT family protein [Verrucomicrobiota bacterium]